MLGEVWQFPQLGELFLIYSIAQLFYTFTIHYNSLSESKLDFIGSFASSLVQRISFFFYLVFVWFSEITPSLTELVFVHVASMAAASLVAYLNGKKHNKIKFGILLKLREQAGFGIFTFGTNISSMIFKNTDSWMLGAILGKMSVASYNPAIRVANLFEVPLGAISSVVFPSMVNRIREKGLSEAKSLYEKSVGFTLMIMLPFIFLVILFSKEIVVFIAGDQYIESYSILQITMLYGAIIPFNRQFGITMNAIGRANINFIVLISNTLLNVVLNYFFIIKYGVIGAAFATLLSYFIILVICEIILHKMLHVSPLNIAKNYLKSHILLINLVRNRIISNGKKS
jgi:O-antigen/teichoic acid export membrane protein